MAHRTETRVPQSGRAEADNEAGGSVGLRACAQRIAEANSGRTLLSILSGLTDDLIAHPLLKAARLQALTRIVATAPSVAALEKLEHHFTGDWAHVSKEAAHRRLQLDLLDSLAEEECAAKAALAATSIGETDTATYEPLGSGNPASNAPANDSFDELDFGDIPYQEAAA